MLGQTVQKGVPLDDVMRVFWEAGSPGDAVRIVPRIVAANPSFDDVWSRLEAGRPYRSERTGRVELSSSVGGNRLDNVAEVPADYTADRRWPLRVILHGGVGRPAPADGGEPPRPLINRMPAGAEIVLHPRSWAGAEWWKHDQVSNVLELVDRLKRRYNVDESRVSITGFSDGGTGAYFFAMRAATPWAACLPLNGHPSVLANPGTGVDGQLYAHNMANCPLYVVNSGLDRLYPAASVAPLVEMLKNGGVPLVWQVHPEAGHDLGYWPVERPRYEAFLASHPRVAHPASVSWETERVDRYNRFRWLVIDRLGPRAGETPLPDVNQFAPTPTGFVTLYSRHRVSGRVDATRTGNRFDVKTRGVQAFTLLLSPDVVNFDQPVQVTVNGKNAFSGAVKRDLATLLAWAARDNDRAMLYAAELHLTVP